MKKIFFFAMLMVGFSLTAQVTTINQNVYGSTVKDAMNTNFTNVQDSLDGVSGRESINTTQFQDTLGWFIVTSYGAVGDGVANDQVAVQNTINAAGDGIVYFPPGTYLVDSITIPEATSLLGNGASELTGASIIKGALNKGFVHFYADNGAGAYGWEYNSFIKNITILGGNSADSSAQHGLVINGSAQLLVENVYFKDCGGYGTLLGHLFGADVVTFKSCRWQNNHIAGGYGQTTSAAQVNAIHFSDCHFIANAGFGLDLTGTHIIINDNSLFQGNDSTGIKISFRGLEANASVNNYVIENTYFEVNGGAAIFAETDFDGSFAHTINGLTIRDCYISENSASVDAVHMTGNITLRREPGSTGTFYFNDLIIGRNNYTSAGSLFNVDANDVLDHDASIFIDQSQFAEFVNLGNASVKYKGGSFSGSEVIIPTAAGLTATMLSPYMYVYLEAAVDITANPQIVDAFDGMEIKIRGYHDTHTLTLDDGTGLSLDGGAQAVLGAGDYISLIYNGRDDVWEEQYRSNN